MVSLRHLHHPGSYSIRVAETCPGQRNIESVDTEIDVLLHKEANVQYSCASWLKLKSRAHRVRHNFYYNEYTILKMSAMFEFRCL